MCKRSGILLVTFLLATAVFSSILWAETAVPTDDTALYLPLINVPAQPPQVLSFTVNVPIADPGETITLSWETTNAVSVTLYHLVGGVFGTFWNVPPIGEMAYEISSGSRNYESFALFLHRFLKLLLGMYKVCNILLHGKVLMNYPGFIADRYD